VISARTPSGMMEPRPPISIIDACKDPRIFGPWFRDRETWAAWFVFLKTIFGISLDDAELAIFQKFTSRTQPWAEGYLEATLIIGRRGGKSLVLALIAAFLAAFYDWSPYLTGGERGTIMVVAADRKQARSIFRYLKGMLSIPLLAGMVQRETQESVDLSNSITVEILAANFKTVRSYTLVAALCDEEAFWPTDEGLANPDSEIIGAIRPAMATIPRAMLLKASSPYARRGDLYEDYRKYFGKEDSPVLVWKAATRDMNPTVPESFIAGAYERDPASASAEYGGEFRSDVESFVSPEAVEGCVVSGRYELPAVGGVVYFGFLDAAGGSGTDSMTICLAHRAEDRVVVDVIREVKPPFSPERVVQDFAQLLKSYHVLNVTADRYAGAWVAERFRIHGIECMQSAKPKSELYKDLLPIINSGGVELLDNAKATAQICSLERRTARSGRDSIDHPPNAHDDMANAIAGAVVGMAISRGGAEGWLEYMRRLSEAEGRSIAAVPNSASEFGYHIGRRTVGAHERVRVPEGISTLYLIDGTSLLVPDDRIVEVSKEDAVAFGQRGWDRLAIV
jgi:hypothetical protein